MDDSFVDFVNSLSGPKSVRFLLTIDQIVENYQ